MNINSVDYLLPLPGIQSRFLNRQALFPVIVPYLWKFISELNFAR
jgi:hypothetical protein